MFRLLVLIVALLGGIFLAIQHFHFRAILGDVREATAAYGRYDLDQLDALLAKLPRIRGENGIGPLLKILADRKARRIDQQVAQMVLWKYREEARDRRMAQFEEVVGATGLDLQIDVRDSSPDELQATLGNPDPAYRMAGCQGAGALAEKAGAPLRERLLELLQEDSFYPVRAAAAKALGALKEAKAVGPLAAAAKDASRYGALCARALGPIPGEAARKALEGLLEVHPLEVARALEDRREAAAVPALVTRLEKGSFESRMATARALAVLGDARGLAAIRRALEAGPTDERILALAASFGIDDGGLLNLQVACASDREVPIRRAAAKALGGSLRELASGALRALLTDGDVQVQGAAMKAIALRRDAAFQEVLTEHLSGSAPEVTVPAIEGVVALGIRDVVPTLKDILANPQTSEAVARAAWVGLKELTGVAPSLDARQRSLFDVAKPIDLR